MQSYSLVGYFQLEAVFSIFLRIPKYIHKHIPTLSLYF